MVPFASTLRGMSNFGNFDPSRAGRLAGAVRLGQATSPALGVAGIATAVQGAQEYAQNFGQMHWDDHELFGLGVVGSAGRPAGWALRRWASARADGLSRAAHGTPGLRQGLARLATDYLGLQACYLAGTPLRTLTGSKPIEQFQSYEEVGDACDWILTRDEDDPNAPLEVRRVLRKFVRLGSVLSLQVRGRIIGTTAEHPHYVGVRSP
jgi:hypothetical protein